MQQQEEEESGVGGEPMKTLKKRWKRSEHDSDPLF